MRRIGETEFVHAMAAPTYFRGMRIIPEPHEMRSLQATKLPLLQKRRLCHSQLAIKMARSRSSNGRFRILANSAILKFYESDAYMCQCDGNLWPVGFEKKKRDGLKNGKTG